MKIPDQYDLDNYYFDLPQELIAQFPLPDRPQSRLLVVDRKRASFLHTYFNEIYKFLPEKSLLVINDSKVFPARLLGRKEKTYGKVEFLLTTPIPLIRKEKEREWFFAEVEGLIRPARGVKQGKKIIIAEDMYLIVLSKKEFGQITAYLYWRGDLVQKLKEYGTIPLPPYIKRKSTDLDAIRYQTVYSKEEKLGSVAAPTAGLHFSEELFEKIKKEKDIEILSITLYVGYGTFSPIRTKDIRKYKIHPEYVELSEETALKLREGIKNNKKIIAVGTTTVRTLEGVADLFGEIRAYKGWIDLYIMPGFKFKVVNHLITNFHLPKSSLLVLVSAFAGRELILNAYKEAVSRRYRFFSYGDAMLIL